MSKRTGKTMSERRYTSIACQACRKRKIKCNNGRPRCSNCELYNVDCIFGEDRRRLSMSARHNASQAPKPSQNSICTSQSSARRAKTASPPNDLHCEPDTQFLGNFNVDGSNCDGHGAVTFFSNNSLTSTELNQDWEYWVDVGDNDDVFNPSNAEKGQQAPLFEITTLDPAEDILTLKSSAGDCSTGKSPSSLGPGTDFTNELQYPTAGFLEDANPKTTKVRHHNVADEISPVSSDVTSQITSRLGRLQIAEDGQPRYYGATSNLHMLQSGLRSLIQPNIRNIVTHGDAAIAQAGLQWNGDSAYESLLINLFFSWYNALMYVVDKSIFLRERQHFRSGQTTDYYSPALENAVYTIGAAYTDRTHPTIKDATDEFFGFRTKAVLDIEIDSPTIATAQALLILSSHEAAHARESRGWIYSGMAVQIITDLGLHLNLELEHSRFQARDGRDDDISVLRRNLFWSTNTIDALWSAYSGRPSLMKRLIHNVQSPIPSRAYTWEYYTDEYSTMAFPKDFDFRAAAYVHVYLAKLMEILARVSEVLYSGVPDNSSNIHDVVSQADADFLQWHNSLPPALRVDCTPASTMIPLPAVIELHLIFQECIILLHRPLISPTDASAPSSPVAEFAAQDLAAGSSYRKCVISAQQVCRLLILLRKRYGLRRLHHQMVHATMTASLIHIFQLCIFPTSSRESSDAQADFLTCIQALGEMGQTYKSASRALDVVTSLRQSWQQDGIPGDRFKRAKLH